MFIGHLPITYLLNENVIKRHRIVQESPWVLYAALVGSVFPDIDVIYQLLFDPTQSSHHMYVTHIPYFWAVIGSAAMAILCALGRPTWLLAGSLFLVNVFLHLILDTIVGQIAWFSPHSMELFAFIKVPHRIEPAVVNYLVHWTFGVEIVITTFAIHHWLRAKRKLVPQPAFTMAPTRAWAPVPASAIMPEPAQKAA